MMIQKIENSQSFNGKLVIVNNLNNKSARCVKKVGSNMQSLVSKKDYNLYLKQDKEKNVINVYADYPFPLKPHQRVFMFCNNNVILPVTSESSKYTEAAKEAIEIFEQNLIRNKQFN